MRFLTSNHSASETKGGEAIQIKIAITGHEPFGDSATVPATTEWIRLTKNWQKNVINIAIFVACIGFGLILFGLNERYK